MKEILNVLNQFDALAALKEILNCDSTEQLSLEKDKTVIMEYTVKIPKYLMDMIRAIVKDSEVKETK